MVFSLLRRARWGARCRPLSMAMALVLVPAACQPSPRASPASPSDPARCQFGMTNPAAMDLTPDQLAKMPRAGDGRVVRVRGLALLDVSESALAHGLDYRHSWSIPIYRTALQEVGNLATVVSACSEKDVVVEGLLEPVISNYPPILVVAYFVHLTYIAEVPPASQVDSMTPQTTTPQAADVPSPATR
jgi:hypothetical protein